MTNEELEMLTKMNTNGIADLRNLRDNDRIIMNRNNAIITQSFSDIADDMAKTNHKIEDIADRLTGVETIVAVYAGIKIGNWIWKKFDLETKVNGFLNKVIYKHDSEEKETYDETSASDI